MAEKEWVLAKGAWRTSFSVAEIDY